MVRTIYCCPSGAPTNALFTELEKMPLLLGTSVNKAASLPAGHPSRLGFQPQRNVGWLHSLPYHTYQVLAQCVQVCLVAQLGREGFQGLPGIVFPSIEAAIYEALYAPPQGSKQRRDQEGGGNDCEGGLLACESDEHPLQHHDANEVECDKRSGEGAVNQGAVYDYIYVVEVVFEDGDVSEDRNDEQGEHSCIKDVIESIPWQYPHFVEREVHSVGIDHRIK